MKKYFLVLLVLSLIGLGSSIVLTQLHYKFEKKGFDQKSFCTVSEFVDCDAVIVSKYAKIFNFPNSELGIINYALISLALASAWIFSKKRAEIFAFLFLSGMMAVGYSGMMAYFSLVKIGVVCLLCSATYVVNVLFFLLLPRAFKVTVSQSSKRSEGILAEIGPYLTSTKAWTHLVVVILFFGVSVLFFRGLNPDLHRTPPPLIPEAYLKNYSYTPQQPIDIEGHPVWGNSSATVTLVEFSDFQCPFCRIAAFTLKPYIRQYKDRLRFVYMNYPLDSACNPAIPQPMHPVSCLAAKAGICAKKQGKFWEYHDEVFKNQKKLSRETLLLLASETGLDRSGFEQCLVSDEVSEELNKDIELGAKLQIRGTPTIFINGRSFREWSNPEKLRLIIEAELASKVPPAPPPPPVVETQKNGKENDKEQK